MGRRSLSGDQESSHFEELGVGAEGAGGIVEDVEGITLRVATVHREPDEIGGERANGGREEGKRIRAGGRRWKLRRGG